MSPFIRDGDSITLAPMAGRDAHVGEIVAVALGVRGRMVVHRIVSRSSGGWIVKGDGYGLPDGEFPIEAMVGRVVRVERAGEEISFGVRPLSATLVAVLSRSGWLTRLRWLRAAIAR